MPRRLAPATSAGATWGERLWPDWFAGNVAVATGARVAMSAARALAGLTVSIYLAVIGYSALRLGVLFVVVGVSSAAMSTAIGFLADRVGRKVFLVVVPILAAGAGAAYAVSQNPVVIFVAAAAGSFGRGAGAGGGTVGPYSPAEQALVTDSVPAARRTAALGRLAFGSSIGAVLGSLLVAALVRGHPARAAALGHFRPVFIALAGCAFAAGLLGLALRDVAPHRATGERPPAGPLLPRRSLPLLYRLSVTNALNGTAVGMFGPFVSYWFFRRYGVSAGTLGELYAVINAVATVANLTAARIGTRFGLVRGTAAFRAIQAILLIPMVLAPTFAVAGAIYLVRMLAQRVSMPLRQSYILGMAHPDERARVAALSTLPSQGTSATSPALAGVLFDHVALAAPFLVGGVLQVLNAAAFYAFFRHRPPEEEQQRRTITAPPPEPARQASGEAGRALDAP